MLASFRNLLYVPVLLTLSSLATAQLNPVAPFNPSTVGPTVTGTGTGHATGGSGGAVVTLEAASSATDDPEGSHLISRVSVGNLSIGPMGAVVEVKSELKGSLIIEDINDVTDICTVDATVDFVGIHGITNTHHFDRSVTGAQSIFETKTPLVCLPPGNHSVNLNLTTSAQISDEVSPITDTNSSNFSAVTGDFFKVSFTQPVAGVVFCTAGTSASGCKATITAGGVASATATSGFMLFAFHVEGKKDGSFFFGTQGQQANPWGNGTSFQCVRPPVVRAGPQTGIGTIGSCDGRFCQDLNALWCPTCPSPAKNPGAGAAVQAQLWYRDPQNTSNQTTSLSNAIQFTVGP